MLFRHAFYYINMLVYDAKSSICYQLLDHLNALLFAKF